VRGGGRNLRLTGTTPRQPERIERPMTTRTRTWMLLAGLSALFGPVGGLVGGAGGIVVFLVVAVAFNFAMFWFSDRIALKMSGARPLEPGEAARARADAAA